MPEDVDEIDGGATFTVGMRVRVRAGTATEVTGTVVEDFGDEVGVPVDVGDVHVVDAARRWAVALDDGGLMFADSHHLTAQ